MAWTQAARQASINSRRARKGSGAAGGMRSMVEKSGMDKGIIAKMKSHLRTIKTASGRK